MQQIIQRNRFAAEREFWRLGDGAQADGIGWNGRIWQHFQNKSAVCVVKQRAQRERIVQRDAEAVAKCHFHQRFRRAAVGGRVG